MQTVTPGQSPLPSQLRAIHSELINADRAFGNTMPAEAPLPSNGDRIEIGDSLPLLPLHESGRLPVSLRPKKVLAPNLAVTRMAHELETLLKVSAAINSIRTSETLQRQLLEFILEVVPADRGAIFLVGKTSQEFASISGWDGHPELHRPAQVSSTTIYRVLREGTAILSNDILAYDAHDSAKSRNTCPIQSLLCVPLVVFNRMLGVIYLDTIDAGTHFEEDHLQLMMAVAGIAALALENVRHVEWMENEKRRLQEDLNIQHSMIGESPRMREVYQCIAKVAPIDSTILICGETGTGKELVARAIHLNSPRANKPFVAINCAALTETLLESELFGHEKGAFTGAIAQKKGRLETAGGGTVFLDEVGELPPTIQAKLLRVLQEREFERVGGTQPIRVDFRLLAATNRDLNIAVSGGSFRQDLYYRLNMVSLRMPPLRERREDIPLLTSFFIRKCNTKCNRQVRGISTETRSCLCSYDWPGNVRELENAIERTIALGSSDFILPEDLPDAVQAMGSASRTAITKYHEGVKETKKQIILRAVEQAGGNYTEAAKLLGVHPNYLHRLIRNLNLKAMIMK